jgi:hypothetical protein
MPVSHRKPILTIHGARNARPAPVRAIAREFRATGPPPAQPAKTTLFAGGNEADVRKSAAGDFFQ